MTHPIPTPFRPNSVRSFLTSRAAKRSKKSHANSECPIKVSFNNYRTRAPKPTRAQPITSSIWSHAARKTVCLKLFLQKTWRPNMLNNLSARTRKPRHIIHTLESKRGHCRRCGILLETRNARLCGDCAAHAPLISYHQTMGEDRYACRVRVDFQLVGDDDKQSRYVCTECLGTKGYHGKICRSCASHNNRGNTHPAARAASKEPLQ